MRTPIRYLLTVIDIRHDEFQHLRPILFQFIAAFMPQILPTVDRFLDSMDEDIACARRVFYSIYFFEYIFEFQTNDQL